MQLLDPITLWPDVTSGNEVEPTLQIYVFIVLLKKCVKKRKEKKKDAASVSRNPILSYFFAFIHTYFLLFGELKKVSLLHITKSCF